MATYVKGDAVANATSYKLFEGNTEIAEASEINFNVTELITAEGEHKLTVKAYADGYSPSDASNEVVFTVYAEGEEGETIPTITPYTTVAGWAAMHYQSVGKLMCNPTLQGYGSKVIAIDVSQLVGYTLTIKATQSVVADAYYSMFTSALPSGISSLSEINGLAYSASATYTFTESDIVEKFVVSTTHQTEATITKVVPSGAKYLFVTTQDNKGGSSITVA